MLACVIPNQNISDDERSSAVFQNVQLVIVHAINAEVNAIEFHGQGVRVRPKATRRRDGLETGAPRAYTGTATQPTARAAKRSTGGFGWYNSAFYLASKAACGDIRPPTY
jgi:hypothetical protein